MAGLWLVWLFVLGRVVITEVMANPRGGDGAHLPEDRNEFVEIYNAGDEAIDLYNYRLTDYDATDVIVAWQDSLILVKNPRVIINSTWLRPGGYAVILDPEYTDSLAQGGEVQPYEFGEGVLILTVGNTTLGNGLQNNDPITIYSIYGDSTTFGTPGVEDGFPFNAGDGFSWERIDILGPDTLDNWAVAVESAGSTPGRVNSVSSFVDVAVNGINIEDSVMPDPGKVFNFTVLVANLGYIPSPSGEVFAWFGSGDTFWRQGLPVLSARVETTLVMSARAPKSQTELWVMVRVAQDKETLNNRARLLLVPGGKREMLVLDNNSFSPNNDGFEDSLVIRYFLPEPNGKLTVAVYDLDAQLVGTVLRVNKVLELEGVVYWNGSQDNGGLAPAGIYLIFLDYSFTGRRVRVKKPVVLIK